MREKVSVGDLEVHGQRLGKYHTVSIRVCAHFCQIAVKQLTPVVTFCFLSNGVLFGEVAIYMFALWTGISSGSEIGLRSGGLAVEHRPRSPDTGEQLLPNKHALGEIIE
ncbi:hypothetical protein J6590_067172 [Homalodisca vitripennis]|nr:hypothetical protein J6590_067172 [Homalodisca vitripennis]